MKNNDKNLKSLFCVNLAQNATFDGIMEFPLISGNSNIQIPNNLIPYSKRKYGKKEDFIMFYEHDKNFFDIIENVDKSINELKKFRGIISPDFSLHRDYPLSIQIFSIYINRLLAYYQQENGLYVIPNVRWGDERTYSTNLFNEKIAFKGLPKNSILSIGTYGQIQSKEDKYHFRNGLISMLEELKPTHVIVYGPMNKEIFKGLENKTNFIVYKDWLNLTRGANYGK